MCPSCLCQELPCSQWAKDSQPHSKLIGDFSRHGNKWNALTGVETIWEIISRNLTNIKKVRWQCTFYLFLNDLRTITTLNWGKQVRSSSQSSWTLGFQHAQKLAIRACCKVPKQCSMNRRSNPSNTYWNQTESKILYHGILDFLRLQLLRVATWSAATLLCAHAWAPRCSAPPKRTGDQDPSANQRPTCVGPRSALFGPHQTSAQTYML